MTSAIFTILPVKQGCLFVTCSKTLATSVSTQRDIVRERDHPLVWGHPRSPPTASWLPAPGMSQGVLRGIWVQCLLSSSWFNWALEVGYAPTTTARGCRSAHSVSPVVQTRPCCQTHAWLGTGAVGSECRWPGKGNSCWMSP